MSPQTHFVLQKDTLYTRQMNEAFDVMQVLPSWLNADHTEIITHRESQL